MPVGHAKAESGPLPAGNDPLDREAAAEADAGIGIPIAEISRWVESWDTPDELPVPKARKVI